MPTTAVRTFKLLEANTSASGKPVRRVAATTVAGETLVANLPRRPIMPYAATAMVGLAGTWIVLALCCTIDPGIFGWIERLI